MGQVDKGGGVREKEQIKIRKKKRKEKKGRGGRGGYILLWSCSFSFLLAMVEFGQSEHGPTLNHNF